MKAYVLKHGKKSLEVSRSESQLWRVAMSIVRERAEWTIGNVYANDKEMLRERGFNVLPIEYQEAK